MPLFIGFVTAGMPLGVSFAFLISAPMVNEVALVLLFGLFGWRVAVALHVHGPAVAMLTGWIIGRLNMERQVEDWVYEIRMQKTPAALQTLSWPGRIDYARQAVRDIVGKVWLYIVAGIAVGAAIHGYVPEGMMAAIMGKQAWWSVPLAVIIGAPIYSNAAGIIPVVQALLGKGAALGTVLAFMMSVIGISLPETIILQKSPEAQADCGLHRRGHRGHHDRGFSVQRPALSVGPGEEGKWGEGQGPQDPAPSPSPTRI